MKCYVHCLLITSFLFFFHLTKLNAQQIDTLSGKTAWVHAINPKEQLPKIASYYGVSMAKIKQLNGLQGNYLEEGTDLKIPIQAEKGAQKVGRFFLHKVKVGEQLHAIAGKYQTSVQEIKNSNISTLAGNRLTGGTYLLVPGIEVPKKQKNKNFKKINMNAFASVGLFAASTWDGSNDMHYTINGRYRLRRTHRKDPYRIMTTFNTMLGYRHDIGKYFFKNLDRVEIKNHIDWYVAPYIKPFLFTSVRTQYLDSYYFSSTGDKSLTSTFMAPGYSFFALGMSFSGDSYNIDLGLYELKSTYVLDQRLYAERKSAFGVGKGEKAISEHGISLRVDVFYYKDEKIKFQSNVYAFATYGSFDLEVRNEFSVQLSKVIKVSIVTELLYDKDFADTMQYKAEVLTGFSFRK